MLSKPNPQSNRRYGICYLCGNKLPETSQIGRQKQLRREHIIPAGVCGKPPKNSKSAWRPTVEVHKECDKKIKALQDQSYISFQNTMSTTEDDWVDSQARAIYKNLGGLQKLSNGNTIGTIGGFNQVCAAAWQWVRGLHAVLHSEYLYEQAENVISPPLPSYHNAAKQSFEEQHKIQRETRSICARMCHVAHVKNKLNRISCWGNRVEFVSAWMIMKNRKSSIQSAHCFWMLNVPGLPEWTTCLSGEAIPWTGMYQIPKPPRNADCILIDKSAEYIKSRKSLKEIVFEILPSLDISVETTDIWRVKY